MRVKKKEKKKNVISVLYTKYLYSLGSHTHFQLIITEE